MIFINNIDSRLHRQGRSQFLQDDYFAFYGFKRFSNDQKMHQCYYEVLTDKRSDNSYFTIHYKKSDGSTVLLRLGIETDPSAVLSNWVASFDLYNAISDDSDTL